MPRFVPTGAKTGGGLATVEIYDDTNLDRRVAVKFIQKGGEHARLLDELAALQRIRSKHVVQVFDVIYKDGTQMGIVEEFIDGHDLSDDIGQIAADATFVKLLYQIAAGLNDIHAAGVVHRDIKPKNIRVDHEGILKIIDFNLAREEKDAKTHGFKGTRGYAAPELYAGGDVTFDSACDVYALAVCAWALLRGEPLPAELRKLPPEPDEWLLKTGGFTVFKDSLEPQLLELLNRCLNADPSKRPTALEISERAKRILLHDQHRARFIVPSNPPFELSKGKRSVRLSTPNLGAVTVKYDGHEFVVTKIEGAVWINNMQVTVGVRLPHCCVIALGAPVLKANQRVFITMDVSHPGVVL